MLIRFTLLFVFFSAFIPIESAYAHGQNHDYEQIIYSGRHSDKLIEVSVVPLLDYLEVTVLLLVEDKEALGIPSEIRVGATQGTTKLDFKYSEKDYAPDGAIYIALLHPQSLGTWNVIIDLDIKELNNTLFLPVEIIKINSVPWPVLISAFVLISTVAWLCGSILRRKIRI